MRWTVHGERAIYESPWVSVALADVEVPGGQRFEHHVVRMPGEASGVVVLDRDRVLLIQRHRFITDTSGWEIPPAASRRGKIQPTQQGGRRWRRPAGGLVPSQGSSPTFRRSA